MIEVTDETRSMFERIRVNAQEMGYTEVVLTIDVKAEKFGLVFKRGACLQKARKKNERRA